MTHFSISKMRKNHEMATDFDEQIFGKWAHIQLSSVGGWYTFGAHPHIDIGGEFKSERGLCREQRKITPSFTSRHRYQRVQEPLLVRN